MFSSRFLQSLVHLSLFAYIATAHSQDPPVDTRSIDEIYAAARKEGNSPLRVFTGGDQANTWLADAWKAAYPDIPIEVTVDLSKYLDGRINRGFDQGQLVADAAVLQTVHNFPRWKSQGHLVPYKYKDFDDLTDAGKDAQGHYWPISWNGFGTIFYDQTKCPNTSIPTTYADFAKPEWKSKLVLTYPNDDDAILNLFAKNTKLLGYSWLDGMAANDVQWVRGTGQPIAVLRAAHATDSTRCVTFTGGGGSEAWWGIAGPTDFLSQMFWTQTMALFAGSQRPETQKLLATYLTTHNQIRKSQLKGYERPADFYEVLTGNFSRFMGDRAEVERWRMLVEDKIGTPQGPSPLLL